MSTTNNAPAQAAPAPKQDQPRKCGSCGADVPPDFEEGQGHSLPCGH